MLAAQMHAELGLGLRSTMAADSLIDDEAYNIETTNEKRLSRYHWEDVLRLREGEPVVVYFNKDQDLQGRFASKPLDAAVTQKRSGIGGQLTTINGRKFIALSLD